MKIRYKDIAMGADGNAAVTTTSKTAFSEDGRILCGTPSRAFATCELNGWGLNHEYKVRGNEEVAFWSSTQSGNDCVFLEVPTVTLEFSEQYTTTGLTIRFAPEAYDYCRRVKVIWYQDKKIKEQREYYPKTPNFVINNTVEAFDRLVFEFKETSLPNKRCKIEGIIIGVIRDFNSDELKSVKAIYEVDLISSTLPANVLDVGVRSNDEVDYIFQRKQPVEAYNGDELIGTYFIGKGQRTGRFDISFSCNDTIGLLDLVTNETSFLYLTDTPLTEILEDVFGDAYEFEIDEACKNATLRGYIEPNKKQREILRQLAFALGVVATTGADGKIHLLPRQTGTGAQIDARQTYIGGRVSTSDTVTEVAVTAYTITDERPGEGDASIEFNGVRYKCYTETKHAYNPNTVTTDPENVKRFDKNYLVNLSNAQSLADNIMAYYQRRAVYSFKHVLSGQKTAGRYTAALPWGGAESGSIKKMTVTTSNITVSDTEMLLA